MSFGREKAFYLSKEWKNYKRKRLSNWDGICQECKKLVKDLPVLHHKTYLRTDWSKRLTDSNIIIICNKCHENIHNPSYLPKIVNDKELNDIFNNIV